MNGRFDPKWKHLGGLGLILLVSGWFSIAPLTFFTVDSAVRFVQIKALVTQNWQTLAVPYPLQAIDPNWEHTPYYYAYSIIENRLYLNISPFFPLVASYLFAGLGRLGLVILLVVGGVLIGWAARAWGELNQWPHPFPEVSLWLTVFGTPVVFYTLELWDHVWGVVFVVWSVYFIGRAGKNGRFRDAFLGGGMLGLGMGQRPELYLFAVAMGLVWLVMNWRCKKLLFAPVLGGITSLLPIWLVQWCWVGHPLGMAVAPHLFDYGRPDSYPVSSYEGITLTRAIKVGRLIAHIQGRDLFTFAAFLLVIVGVAGLVLGWRVPRWRQPRLFYVALGVLLVGYGLWLVVGWQTPLDGLLTTFPPIVFVLMQTPKRGEKNGRFHPNDFLLATTLLFIGLMLAVWPAFGGTQWGARYLLAAYPLLVWLAIHNFLAICTQPAWQQIARHLFIALFATSLLIQLIGVRLLFKTHIGQIPTVQAIDALPAEVLITNHPFLPVFMSRVDDKMWLYVNNEAELADLVPKLTSQQITEIAVVPLEGSSLRLPPQIDNVFIEPQGEILYRLIPKE